MLEQIILRCGHCGNKTLFVEHGIYTFIDRDRIPFKNSDDVWEYWAEFTFHLLECQTCSQPTLQQTATSSEDDEHEILHPPKILYPANSSILSGIPLTIRDYYEEALNVRHISARSCAVMVGLTLEAVCNYEKAPGNTLAEKINSLFATERFPKTVKEIVVALKKLRNLGAHDDSKGLVTERDVPIMLDLVEVILEYLYLAPAKLEALKDRSEKS